MDARRLLLAGAAALPGMAGAAQWQLLPQFSLAADADSNRRLQPVERDSESGVFGAALALVRATEISTFTFVPRLTLSRYSGEDAMDSDDWGANALWSRRGERTEWQLSGGYADQSTLTTELGETGLVQGNTRQHAASASLSVVRYLGQRHTLQFQASGSDIDYEDAAFTGLVGYRYPAASLTYAYTLSPRFDATVSARTAQLDAPERHLRSDTTGGELGFRFRLTERLNLEASAGQSQTTAHGATDRERSFRGALSWQGELSTLELSLARDVEPSGRGVLVHADDLRCSYTRKLGERWSFDGTARVSRRADFASSFRSSEYRYGAVLLAVSRRLDENWTVGAGTAYSRQQYELPDRAADGQRFGLTLTWRPL